MEKLLAITAISPDRAGLIKDLSEAVTSSGGSIQQSRMIALGTEFAMIVLVSGNWHVISRVREQLDTLEKSSDLTLTLRDTDSCPVDASAPYVIDIVSLDHEGIILDISGFFASRKLAIPEMSSRRYNAPHTGAAMFSVQLTVNIPADTHIATLRDEFLAFCDEQNLDAIMEPAQR